jgi:nitroimidazol reductase NimA-like FMN-containing flavoprotein (pyridoxamine 5'-phosphate oxidase superfamily)
MTGYTHDGPQILDADASWDLVEGTHVARLAVSVRGEPDIYPVTVRAHQRTLAFRTVPGTKLATLTTNERVALEWDHVDDDGAWSVVAHGTAHRVRTEHEVDAVLEDTVPLVPVVDVPTEEWVVIEVHELTGRRFARSET